ncbi:MAG: TlpA disulfide reductase family protein [Bacteroidota bacterium]|nr:TlpA disulfide reductase family protein [Bacteroidota bacterium]
MKKIIATLICLFVFFIISASVQLAKHKGYVINGTFNGLDSGIIRMLSINGNVVMDSSLIVKGKFSMHGKIGLPQQFRFNVSPGNWNFLAFVEDTLISLSIDTTGANQYGDEKNHWSLIWEIHEEGSTLSDVFAKFKNETHQKYYKSVITSLREKLSAIGVNAKTTDNVNREIDSLKTLGLTEQKDWIENYINHKPSSIAGVFLFSQYYQSSPGMSLSYLDEILKKFSAPATSSTYFEELEGIAVNLKNAQRNSIAPDFTLLKRDKSEFKFSSTKGNYTLLDFWASWCIPCRKAIPHWKIIYSKYRPKGLIIVSISNDRNWDDWTKALDKEKMPWIQVIDEFASSNETAKVSDLFGIKAFPYYILIDKDGKIILSTNDESMMQSKIQEILK